MPLLDSHSRCALLWSEPTIDWATPTSTPYSVIGFGEITGKSLV